MKIVWMSEVELSLDGGSRAVDFSLDFEVDDMLCSALAFANYRTIVSRGDYDTPPAIDHECIWIDLYFDKFTHPIITDEMFKELEELISEKLF